MLDLDQWIEQTRALSASLPFGDSQAKKIMFANGHSPAQQRRHHVLQLREKLTDLKRAQFNRQRTLVDMAEIKEQVARYKTEFDLRRLQIDLAEKEFDLAESEKYIADAILECQAYQSQIDELPAISREDYERQEASAWASQLLAELEDQQTARGWVEAGHITALRKLGLDIRRVGGDLMIYPNPERMAYLGLNMSDLPLLTAPQEALAP